MSCYLQVLNFIVALLLFRLQPTHALIEWASKVALLLFRLQPTHAFIEWASERHQSKYTLIDRSTASICDSGEHLVSECVDKHTNTTQPLRHGQYEAPHADTRRLKRLHRQYAAPFSERTLHRKERDTFKRV